MQKQLKIQQVSVRELNPAPYNPRIWTPEAVEQLTESMKRFGLVDPIIANSAPNRKNVVVGGHFRLKVAKDLGYSEVPVVFVNLPDIEKEKELNLRLNKNTGDWDYELLKNFDVEFLLDAGFDDASLSRIWDEQLSVEDDDFDLDEALKQIKEPKSKTGDLYKLGRHYLICGDSTDPQVIKRLVGESKANMLYFDPPYNIN